MKPLAHQKKFVKNYTGSRLIVHEGGTGKTVCACLWLKDGRDDDALVIAPKKVIRKWQKALKDWGTKATVISTDSIKKPEFIRKYSAVVVDEADEFASPLFVGKQRSARSAALYNFIKEYEPDILLLTATPIRSNPWNLHTLMCFSGEYIDWKDWRSEFFELKRPEDRGFGYLQRPAYVEVYNWREKARERLEQVADIVLLRDCVKELPPVIEEIIDVDTPEFIVTEDNFTFQDRHRHEQQGKAKEIIAAGKEFRKILVVAYYREQIEQLQKELSKDKPTFAIWGDVKDQEAVIEEATKADDCYFIVQASIGAGFDADTFSCVIYTSMSYAVRDYAQMNFRVRRIHNLSPVKRIFLMGGKCDYAVHHNVMLGKNFVPSEWSPKLL